MPDFAMCTGDGCPLKDKCFRYQANPEQLQSYFLTPPHKNGTCDFIINSDELLNTIKGAYL